MKLVLLGLSLLLSAVAFAADNNGSNILDRYALMLLKKMPESGYGVRRVCIYKNTLVVGTYSPGHWSQGLMLAAGTVDNFPARATKLTTNEEKALSIGSKGRFFEHDSKSGADFVSVKGTVFGVPADVCVVEQKMVLEMARPRE